MRLLKHKNEWWVNPGLPPNRPHRIPKRLLAENPVGSELPLPARRTGKVGGFGPSYKWERYCNIGCIDAGYITPLYSLKDIAARYHLSHNAQRYYKKNILPEPFDIVRRHSVAAHHWSRFTLMVLDEVLLDLERLGYQQFLSSFEGHVNNLHAGVEFLEGYYADKVEAELPTMGDSFGVAWD